MYQYGTQIEQVRPTSNYSSSIRIVMLGLDVIEAIQDFSFFPSLLFLSKESFKGGIFFYM